LPFSKVTAPKEPNFPFITGPKSPTTGAGGAEKHLSNAATESPPPSIIGQEEEEEEEEEEEHFKSRLRLLRTLLRR
jgi:hypothetical protein